MARRARRAWQLRDRRIVAGIRGRTDLRINVGSSSSRLEDWLNVDLLRDPEGQCLRLDATKPWPFEAGSADAVNSEHFIEHLSEQGARAFLREAHRALHPGGVIRTSTPDLEGLAQALLARDARGLEVHRSHGYAASTHGELVNNYVYGSGHRRLYDEETLALLLEQAGFVEPRRCAFGESAFEVLRGIDRHDPRGLEQLVLCVEAVKPRG